MRYDIGMSRILPAVFLFSLIGCGPLIQSHDPAGKSVELRRWMDNLGNSHNDVRTITAPDELARLRSFFPEMQTNQTSDLHGPWQPLLLIRFVNNDDTQTTITTDYHLYRIGDGTRGDFIIKDGFSDEVDHLFAAPPPPPPS